MLRVLPCVLVLFVTSCGGGGGGGGSLVPTTIFLSRLFSSTAGTRTFLVTPPGDGSANFNETVPSPPSPCSPAGSVNLVATNVLDRQFVSGRRERIYVSVDPGNTVSIKGSWISTNGTTGNFEVFNPPIVFPDLMSLNAPVQRTGQVHQQTGGEVAFASNECTDFTAGTVTGSYDFIYVYSGQASVSTPFQEFPGNAFKIDRNEVRPGGTETFSSFFGGGLGEVRRENGGTVRALQSVM